MKVSLTHLMEVAHAFAFLLHAITIKERSTINVYFKLQHTYVAAHLSVEHAHVHVHIHVCAGDETEWWKVSAAAD